MAEGTARVPKAARRAADRIKMSRMAGVRRHVVKWVGRMERRGLDDSRLSTFDSLCFVFIRQSP